MKKMLVIVSALILISVNGYAGEWQILGPKALGMGGAHVAVTNDAHANYWNPAAYGFFGMNDKIKDDYSKRKWSAVASAGAGVQVHEDLGEQVDKLMDYDYAKLTDSTFEATEVKDFVGLVNQLKEFNENKNRVATVLADAGLSIQVGHFGVGVIGLGQMSGMGDIDTLNIAPHGFIGALTITDFANQMASACGGPCTGSYLSPSQKSELDTYLQRVGWTNATDRDKYINAMDYGLTQSQAAGQTVPSNIIDQIKGTGTLVAAATGGGSIDKNESSLDFKGHGIMEVPLTYGRAINNNLAVGGNVKYMKARTFDVEVPAFDKDFADLLDDARDKYEESTALGLDLAALYRIGDIRLGIVGRNLNRPKFDVKRYTFSKATGQVVYNTPTSGEITEEPQVRAGVAYKPLSILTLAADYDLTENDTTVSDDYKSRNIAVGAELDLLKFLQLRAGMYKNLSESDMGNIYTAGLGLNLYLFNLDAGVSWASEKVTLDGDDYPKEVRGELALSMLF